MPQADKNTVRMKERWHKWLIWQCVLPISLVFCLWALGAIAETDRCFFRAFADGILLIFSAMLLIGVSLELTDIQASGHTLLSWIKHLSMVLAVLILVLYGPIKIDVMQNDYFSRNPLPGKLIIYSVVNILVAGGAVGFAAYGFWKKTEKLFIGIHDD